MNYVSTAEEGIVWGLDRIGDVWILNTGGISDEELIENETMGWVLVVDAHLVQLDVGNRGRVAGVTSTMDCMMRMGVNHAEPMGTGW
jgi:hypothetical protein